MALVEEIIADDIHYPVLYGAAGKGRCPVDGDTAIR